ncbi:e3 ubiquitin-protein ligase huwe1-like protein [Dermatophagoides farinae]|uniref:HECT-type E3 ubiquitin transferase n=1 Tax=Dermatophagoides farinae TaxID=6954 RepID=A0A9D4SES7_DERFA|nr:E3 ubiquitin-protein ligase HUWE1-like isoform X2 [Dermatophagoides farinae]KAH7639382.1 e3 ubiquitin-protein ligase huwe1-like protein [Dermatophagoides farinae]
MKIDRSKSKKSSSEVPFDCKLLIEELKQCNEDQMLIVLKRIKTWSCGKCELYHWIDVLDLFDTILEECCRKESSDQWILPVDLAENVKKRELLLAVISFTSLLIEHSFSRHLYNSIEHLITLLSSNDMQIVLAILNLLFVFSKRSNFFSRISIDRRQSLMSRLYYLAENWGGKDQGFGLAQCCQNLPLSSYPSNATTFNFEFYLNNNTNNQQTTNNESKTKSTTQRPLGDNGTSASQKFNNIVRIHIENVHLIDKPVSILMAEIVEQYQIPVEQQMQIFTQLRLTKNFANYHTRLQCVQARINALSIMVYCQAMSLNQEGYYSLLYNGLIEELVEVLELRHPELIEIKSASLKTLTSIIHLDRNSKMKVIIDSTGANSYHGFLPILVRNCIQSLILGNMEEYPLNFVTALFSFLYHLASYDNGCEALVQCGIMESLLRVVDWKGPKADADVDHLMFVTRAVRVIDLLTNQFIDMNAFQSNNGLNTFVQRLEYEVNICRTEQPYEIEVPADRINRDKHYTYDDEIHIEESENKNQTSTTQHQLQETPMEVEISNPESMAEASTSKSSTVVNQPVVNNNLQCYPQRAALLKSMLNFLKKAVQCTGFSELVRPLMYGNFPRSLRHIISNAEYYGSSLFLLATDVVSVYVYQEPSLLSVIQDNGLTDVVLHALLVKNVPPTKEVLASLPTVFTSLCLNHRGLEAFIALRPFERFFKIFLSPDYLQAMRRRRSNSGNDTATTLGNAMDELMRHQPSLRSDVIGAILKLLEEICRLGSDLRYICTKASSSSSSSNSVSTSKSFGAIGTGSATDGSHHHHHHHGSTSTAMAFDESSSNAVDGDGDGSNQISGSNVNNDSSSSEEDDYDDDDTTTTTTTAAAATTTSAADQNPTDSSSTDVIATEATTIPSALSSSSTSLTISNDDPMKSQTRPAIAQTTTSAVSSDITNIVESNRQQIPLIDYILNVMRFLEAILANNSTDDHCQEFLHQNGLDPLFRLLKLHNLPLDFPVMPSCYSVATVLKTLLNLTHEKDIFTKGLEKLKEILEKLSPLSQTAKTFNGSILLEDLINHLSTKKAVNFVTPVLQLMAAAHAYIVMFLQICRTSQGEIRSISIDQWGSPLGIEIIGLLSQLYIALVWESTLLLGLNDSTSQKYEFVKIQIEKLNTLLKQSVNNGNNQASTSSDMMMNVDGTLSAMSPMEVDNFDANSDPSISASISQDNSKISKNSSKLIMATNSAVAVKSSSHHQHQKYIKPLLAVASRLGRALAELFGLLVKLCVGPSPRRRNHHQPYLMNSQTMTPSKPVQNIAKHLNVLLYNGLSWQPSFDTNIPKFRLTFYVCSIGFSSPMLFDDRKYPYHIMLRNFILSGGQDAFFDCFHMAFEQQSNNSSPDLPDGIIEFLDSWLLLLEKMTNPQTLFDSPHAYSSSKQTPLDQSDDIHFDPIQYLIRTHKKAFPCIMELWNNKLYRIKCDRVIESLITIFSHLLKGETIIEKHLGLTKVDGTNATTSASTSSGASSSSTFTIEPLGELIFSSVGGEDGSSSTSSSVAATSASSTTAQSAATRSEQNPNVQTLMEMGFSRDLAIDALLQTSDDVNAATEWILQHFPRFLSADNEEEEMIRAIALSLSDNSDESGSTTVVETLTTTTKTVDNKSKQPEKAEPKNKDKPLVNEIPLRKDEINTFTDNILVGILKLIDQLPIIHKCCELLISISKRNGHQWFEEMFSQLIDDIIRNIAELQKHTSYIKQQEKSTKSTAIEWAHKLVALPEAYYLQSRIHLLVLLFNETKNLCAKQIAQSELLNHLIDLLENGSYLLNVAYEKERSIPTPKWVAPSILLIDLYEKNALACRRRKRLLLESSNCRRTWKYFDERTVRWSAYQTETNKTIDEAFRSGEQFCKIQVARRRYTVNFTTMLQINDDTDNYRPIMFFVDSDTSKTQENKSTSKNDTSNDITNNKDDGKKSKDKDSVETKTATKDEEQFIADIVEVDFLDEKQCHTIIEAMVNFIQLPIDSDALNAIIRLILRLTRNYDNACFFVEKNGISRLLKIPQCSIFPGFVPMATLIIRHMMEDSLSLQTSMDKILRAQANSPNSIRELHYMFRHFSPAACRDSDTFKKSAMNILRINVPQTMTTPRRMTQDEERMTPLLRAVMPSSGSKSVTHSNDGSQNTQHSESSSLEISKVAKDIICELLNILPLQYSLQQELNKTKKSSQQQPVGVVSADDSAGNSKPNDPASVISSNNDKDSSKEQDVFRTHTILSILAELTISYHSVAKVICEHTYTFLYKDTILDDCTALSFILDNLLSYAQHYGDKECATYSRALFTAIASVPFSHDIHQTLVIEIKNALNRAVFLPESYEKHAKIQALSPLITSIVEAQCTSSSLQNNHSYYRAPLLSASSPLIKLLIRKNLITDLAKVIQYLDLSSPMMITTVNSLLKTLDFLSKTLNTPQNPFTSRHHHNHNQQQQSAQSRHQRNLLSHSSFTIPMIDLDSASSIEPDGSQIIHNNDNDPMLMEQDHSENLTTNSTTTTTTTNNNQDSSSALALAPNQILNADGSIIETETTTSITQSPNTNAIHTENMAQASTMSTNSQNLDENTENELFLDSVAYDNYNNSHPRSGTFTSDELRTDDDDYENDGLIITDQDGMNDGDHEMHHDSHVVVGNSNHVGVESTTASSDGTESDDADSDEHDDDDEDDVDIEDDDDDEEEEQDDQVGSAQEDGDEDDDDEHMDDDDDDDEDDDGDDDEDEMDRIRPEDLSLQQMLDDQFGLGTLNNDVIYSLEEVLPQFLNYPHRVSSSSDYLLPFSSHHHHHHLVGDGENVIMNGHSNGGHFVPTSSVGRHTNGTGSSMQIHHPLLNYNSDQMNNGGGATSSSVAVISNAGSSSLVNNLAGSLVSLGSHAVNPISASFLSANNTVAANIGIGSAGGGGGGHRLSRNPLPRTRAIRSYFHTGHNWHVAHFNTRTSPTHILQRLLGSASQHEFAIPSVRNPFSRHDLDLRDETFDFVPLSSTPNSSIVSNSFQNNQLNSIPSTIQRWHDEARLLDGEYMYDALLLIKPEIIRHLEKLKEQELQEKKRKEKEDMDATAGDAKNKSASNTAENNLDREIRQAMQQPQQQHGSGHPSQFEELHAHIEQLTNSVINQVLESTPQQQSNSSNELTNDSSNSDRISRMEVVISNDDNDNNDEQPQQPQVDEVVPMSVVVNENIPSGSSEDPIPVSLEDLVVESEASVARSEAQNVDIELMDHQSSNVTNQQQSDTSGIAEGNLNQEQQSGTETSTISQPSASSSYQLTPEERAILGDQELPEGVDPSFLAALPENIRQEVIAEQFRIQRLNQLRNNLPQPPATAANESNQAVTAINQSSNTTNAAPVPEISEDFLAALPPNIQEEVLAQQRAEQQRLNAQNTNPDTPVDPVSFFRSLPPSLRRQVLSDLDDSQVQLLPPEFANEARTLRREYEQRNRQIHDRLFDSNSAILRIIRSAAPRTAALRYDGLSIPSWTHARFSFRNGGGSSSHDNNRYGYGSSSGFGRHTPRAFTSRSLRGKYLLDYDALSSILILLFIHDSLISSIRLHRVIKNLCLHSPTRQWVIQSLLEIMEKTKESVDSSSSNNSIALSADDQTLKALTQNHFVSWLSITLDSSFGSKTNVFFLSKSIGSSSSSSIKKNDKVSQIYTISINPQASLFVCRNVLDILISLAKTFPEQFICYSPPSSTPLNSTQALQKNFSATSLNTSSSSIKDQQHENIATTSNGNQKPPPSFFDVLMRHDFIHATKKTKSKQASSSNLQTTSIMEIDSVSSTKHSSQSQVDYSPFSQLLNLLSHHFIKKSPVLTDRLIRLMTHITTALTPDTDNRNQTTPINLSNEIKEKLNEIEKTIANERLLKLVVDVLVSKTCSEDGLVDATSLLIKLSNLFSNCRNIFYKLLLNGVRHLGQTVYDDINALSIEMSDLLSKLNRQQTSSNTSTTSDNESHEKNIKGQTNVQDRYSNMTIIINAQSNAKHNIISGKEVQLPSMSNLISKSSSQFLFLRILKIIMHIREINAKNQNSKQQQPQQDVTPSSADPSNDNQTTTSTAETKMEVDLEQDKLSTELQLDHLWEKLSDCLSLLSEAPDDHVVLVLQPAVESFFLVHAPEKSRTTAASSGSENQRSVEPVSQQLSHLHQTSDALNADAQYDENRQYSSLPADTQKFLIFAEKHRVVLNQILRQSNIHLANGPFAVLVDHTRILDFDVKRRYFRQELDRLDQGTRRDDLPVHIRREHVFEDSYRELNRRTSSDWKNRFYIVFEGEEGQDAGGLLREWYTIISREIFNPNYALFTTSPGDRVTYMINSASHCNSNHLSYFKFVGRVISKAIHDNKLLDCYFTRSFYKHILGKLVKYTDMESEDYSFYQGLVFLLEHNVNELGTELTFSLEIQEFGVTEVRDLVPNGRNIIVTEENKHEYVKLVCQEKMTGSIKKQLNSFLEGFYEIIPKRLISIFNEHELELLISGLPNIDIDDLKANTDYHKYQATSLQIQWFWRALRTFDQADRAKFLQFVTGTSKVPLQGFTALEGMNGPQKFQIHLDDRSTDRLPSAHTCFNQLDLPAYETYDKLRMMLLKAIHECSEGFGFA